MHFLCRYVIFKLKNIITRICSKLRYYLFFYHFLKVELVSSLFLKLNLIYKCLKLHFNYFFIKFKTQNKFKIVI